MLEFLPRDAMHSVVSVPLCGICLSVTFIYRIEMSNHILKLFSLPDRHAILVFFRTKPLRQYSDWDPLTGRRIRGL